jgi:tRNA-Thr(GGU) m(6)t(6)A37 methyltransferase TsaA
LTCTSAFWFHAGLLEGRTMSLLVIRPVGVVRSRYLTPASLPNEGGPAELVIDERYSAELDGVERSSHLIVVAQFHLLLRGDGPSVHPHRRHAERCGAFAARCPDRPNRLAVTVARLLDRRGPVLRVAHLDLVDGTPILDLKPYVPGWDAVFSAWRQRRVRLAEVSDRSLHEFLTLDLANHLGEQAAGRPARTALAAVSAAVRRLGLQPRDPELAVEVNRRDAMVDALMGLMGATFASGRLALLPAEGPLRLLFRGRDTGLELTELPETATAVDAMPARFLPCFGERALEQVVPGRLSAG